MLDMLGAYILVRVLHICQSHVAAPTQRESDECCSNSIGDPGHTLIENVSILRFNLYPIDTPLRL